MGWLYMRPLAGHATPKAYLDAQFTYDRDTGGSRVLASSLVGRRTYYAAVEWITAGSGEREVWGLVCLVRYNPRDREGLVFGYKDTTFASIGTEYKLSDTITLRGGVAYDETPTTYSHRDVRVPDVTRKWLSFGLGWTPKENTEFNFGYTHLFTNEPAVNATSETGNVLQGKYKVRGDILAASINYKF